MVSSFTFAEEVEVRFGKLKVSERIGADGYRFEFMEETKRAPLLTLEEGGVYGIEYRAPENYEYTVQVKAIIPLGVTETGGDLVSTKKNTENTVMVFKSRSVKGTSVEPFLFTKGDPPGTYTLEVTINNNVVKKLSYQAYVPTTH